MVLLAPIAEADWNGLKVVTKSYRKPNQRDRIIEALGPMRQQLPGVNEETLSRYFPVSDGRQIVIPVHRPLPGTTNSLEEQQDRCTVLELLDPINDICDEFDGIFCKTRKGTFEVNLPLIELEIPQDSPNFQLIEDYWFWFWNWR